MKYYKFLTTENKGKYSDYDFTKYLPDGENPGKWLLKIENLVMCENGYHCFTPEHILEWLEAQLYEVEIKGNCIEGDKKTVAQQMRFVRKVDAWNDKTARLFTCWCAEQVLPIYEKKYPNDTSPRRAIETARLFADGKATAEELAAARDAAWAAARDAAWAAASAAAWAAARAAAWAAARDVAEAAAWDAARAAARDAAWAKYTNHLLEMLGISDEA